MGPIRAVSILLLSPFALAGCASNRPVEEEPLDPAIESAAPVEPVEETAPGEAALEGACPEGSVPLAVKLLVLLRHPNDPVPALPADGFSIAVDGEPVATGLRVGQVHTACVAPGEHEVTASGGKLTRTVRVAAPGEANLPVAGGGSGSVPGLPPGQSTSSPGGTAAPRRRRPRKACP